MSKNQREDKKLGQPLHRVKLSAAKMSVDPDDETRLISSIQACKTRAVLSAEQAVEIFQISLDNQICENPISACLVAFRYGVTDKAVRDIWKGRTWCYETRHLDPKRKACIFELKPPGRPKSSSKTFLKAMQKARTALNSRFKIHIPHDSRTPTSEEDLEKSCRELAKTAQYHNDKLAFLHNPNPTNSKQECRSQFLIFSGASPSHDSCCTPTVCSGIFPATNLFVGRNQPSFNLYDTVDFERDGLNRSNAALAIPATFCSTPAATPLPPTTDSFLHNPWANHANDWVSGSLAVQWPTSGSVAGASVVTAEPEIFLPPSPAQPPPLCSSALAAVAPQAAPIPLSSSEDDPFHDDWPHWSGAGPSAAFASATAAALLIPPL